MMPKFSLWHTVIFFHFGLQLLICFSAKTTFQLDAFVWIKSWSRHTGRLNSDAIETMVCVCVCLHVGSTKVLLIYMTIHVYIILYVCMLFSFFGEQLDRFWGQNVTQLHIHTWNKYINKYIKFDFFFLINNGRQVEEIEQIHRSSVISMADPCAV